MIKVSDYIAQFIACRGVKHIFMLAGGGSMHLVDSFGSQNDMEYVCCLHEQAVAFATQAYAEYLSTLGAALVTTGPGGTNTVTGLAAAWLDSTACIFISGQVKRADLLTGRGVRSMGPQEVDIVSVVTPLTKYAKTLIEPNDVRYELEKAVYYATNGRRGPVWLDVPLDVQAVMVDEASLRSFSPIPAVSPTPDIRERVAKAIELLKKAERPVLFIGNGARQAYLTGMVEELVNTLRVPVLLTWKAMDMLPDDHEYFAGRPGSIASRGANFTQQNADWIMVLGARLDLPQVAFSHKNFARGAKKVLVDIDVHEIAKFDMTIDVPVHADVQDFLEELLPQLKQIAIPNTAAWMKQVKNWLTRYPVVLPEYWEKKAARKHLCSYRGAVGAMHATGRSCPRQFRCLQRHLSSVFPAQARATGGQRAQPGRNGNRLAGNDWNLPREPQATYHLHQRGRRLSVEHPGSGDCEAVEAAHQILHPV